MQEDLAIIGFGEAAQAFAAGGGWQSAARAFDKLTDRDESREAKEADYRRLGVSGAATLEGALEGAPFVLSLVTAGEAVNVARQAAAHLAPGTLFCDMNSVSPETKQAAAAEIEAAGGHYVDVAIMSPVNPGRTAVPLLASGAEAATAARRLARLGFSNCRVIGTRVGQASAVKMIRSVVIKGIEALTAEAVLAADAVGVTEELLSSLDASEKARPWAARADYNLDRMLVHGGRRAEEMDEVVKTLRQLGVAPTMSEATAQRQREIGKLGIGAPATGLAAKIRQISLRKADAA